jgi:hypothetical protein
MRYAAQGGTVLGAFERVPPEVQVLCEERTFALRLDGVVPPLQLRRRRMSKVHQPRDGRQSPVQPRFTCAPAVSNG